MEELHNHNACSLISNNGEHSGVSSTISPESHPNYEDVLQPETRDPPHRTNLTATTEHAIPAQGIGWITMNMDDTLSCVAIVFTFSFFVCMVMIMGVYGSVTKILGPNSSILIKPSSLFVEYVKIEESYEGGSDDGAILLYGFHKAPPLDVVLTWSDTHNLTLQSTTHKAWIYDLNRGSHINISYNVISSNSSSSMIFVIAQGYEGLEQWFDNPLYPNATLCWQAIKGSGTIQQDIYTSSDYYIALGNLDEEATPVELDMRFRSMVYDTTGADDKCSVSDEGECRVKISVGAGNAALLTSPGPIPGREVNEWYVKLSYGPRWITYLGFVGGIGVLVLGAIQLLSRACSGNRLIITSHGRNRMMRLPPPASTTSKDDDVDWGSSSYDSLLSQDDGGVEQNEHLPLRLQQDGKSTKENNCAICFDAPRDCFFLPCGHCVACFPCSTRIAEATGTCSICHRPMKKVRKIFTV